MKILVAFYTRSGRTKRCAEILAEILKADLDEIHDKKNRKGLFGFLLSGFEATVGKTTKITYSKDPSEYDFVILGTPVWNGRLTPALRTYLMQNRDKIRRAVFFATCIKESGKCVAQMKELYGGEVLGEGVFKEKTLEDEARDFAMRLKSALNLG